MESAASLSIMPPVLARLVALILKVVSERMDPPELSRLLTARFLAVISPALVRLVVFNPLVAMAPELANPGALAGYLLYRLYSLQQNKKIRRLLKP